MNLNLKLRLVLKGFVTDVKKPRRRSMLIDLSKTEMEIFESKNLEFRKKISEICSIPNFERLEMSMETESGIHLADAQFDSDGMIRMINEVLSEK